MFFVYCFAKCLFKYLRETVFVLIKCSSMVRVRLIIFTKNFRKSNSQGIFCWRFVPGVSIVRLILGWLFCSLPSCSPSAKQMLNLHETVYNHKICLICRKRAKKMNYVTINSIRIQSGIRITYDQTHWWSAHTKNTYTKQFYAATITNANKWQRSQLNDSNFCNENCFLFWENGRMTTDWASMH